MPRKTAVLAPVASPFELSTILSSVYLAPVRDIGDAHVGSTPWRDFWTREMVGRLDSRRSRLAVGSSERAVADAILGDAPSFRAKWAGTLAAAEPTLIALAQRGVNPNVFCAAVVHYGWEWRRGDRGVVSAGCPPHILKSLAVIASVLGNEECAAFVREGDAFEQFAARLAMLRNSDHPDDIAAFEGNDFDPAVEARSRDGELANLNALGVEVVDVKERLQRLHDRLQRVGDRMSRRRAQGHPPEERVNTMIVLLACIFREQTGQPRFARIGRLLDAATLPGLSADYFAQDGERGDRIRQRLYTLRSHPDAQRIASAVRDAMAFARQLPKL